MNGMWPTVIFMLMHFLLVFLSLDAFWMSVCSKDLHLSSWTLCALHRQRVCVCMIQFEYYKFNDHGRTNNINTFINGVHAYNDQSAQQQRMWFSSLSGCWVCFSVELQSVAALSPRSYWAAWNGHTERDRGRERESARRKRIPRIIARIITQCSHTLLARLITCTQ